MEQSKQNPVKNVTVGGGKNEVVEKTNELGKGKVNYNDVIMETFEELELKDELLRGYICLWV